MVRGRVELPTFRFSGAFLPSRGVAGGRLISHLTCTIVAGRRPASLGVCRRWLLLWLPVWLPELAGGESTAESPKRSSRLQKCSPADTKIRKFFIVRPPGGRVCLTDRPGRQTESSAARKPRFTRDHSAVSMGSERIRTRPRAIVTIAPVPSSSATAGRFATSKAACCSGVSRSADLSRTTDGRTAPREMASSSPKSVSAEIITSSLAAA